MEFETVLHLRQSVRKYTKEPISQDDINFLLQAGQSAPAGKHNFRGYALAVVTDPVILGHIRKEFQYKTGRETDPIFGAPAVIIIFETPQTIPYLKGFDAGGIAENIQLAAFSRGLGAVCVFSFIYQLGVKADYLQYFKYPQGYLPLLSVVIGHPQNPILARTNQKKIEVSEFSESDGW